MARRVLVAALCGGAVAAVHKDRLAQIKEIESTPGVTWKAAAHPRFASEAPGASRSLCGVKPGWREHLQQSIARGEVTRWKQGLRAEQVPDSFDSAAHWPQCAKSIGDIRDQSNCGCCWAFAGAEAASDRMCIATNGSVLTALSAEDVCFCASMNGCGGGMIDMPWSYIKTSGAVTGGQYQSTGPFTGLCADFSLPHCHHHGPQGKDPFPAEGQPGCPSEQSPKCPTSCDARASSAHKDFAADKYAFEGEVKSAHGEQEIQEMIMAGGPVETAFTVYSDFENYAGGIYHHVTGGFAGGHAVKIVGWGVESGVKYWKIANSWNPYWGEDGYFRIRRGNNEGGVEDGVTGASETAKWAKKSELDGKNLLVV